jgi:hypothetical protein
MTDETIEPAADVASSHTTGRMSGRIEIVGRMSGRRRWTVEVRHGQGYCLWHEAMARAVSLPR